MKIYHVQIYIDGICFRSMSNEHTNNHLAKAFQRERKKVVALPEIERLTSQTAAQATTTAAAVAATVVHISN